MQEIEILKKKIIYKSRSVGYRELSIVLQNFLQKNIEKLSFIELNSLLEFISMDDKQIFDFLMLDTENLLSDNIEKKIIYFIKSYNH